MKLFFLLVNMMTDHEAIARAVHCAFDSGVTSLVLLLAFGLSQAIRYSAHRRNESTV